MTDYADLVKDLNARCMCAPHCNDPASCDMCEKESHCIHCDAADAIETLVRERDEARAERDNEKAAGGPTPDNGRPLVEGADKEKSKAAAPAADHSPPKEPPND